MNPKANKRQAKRTKRNKSIALSTYEEFRKSYERLVGAAYDDSLKKIDSKIESAFTRH